jgi:ketosteroid isomerase-like protein
MRDLVEGDVLSQRLLNEDLKHLTSRISKKAAHYADGRPGTDAFAPERDNCGETSCKGRRHDAESGLGGGSVGSVLAFGACDGLALRRWEGAGFQGASGRVDEAWGSLRAENAGKYYVKGPHNVFFDVAPFRYENWAAYQQGAQKLFLDPSRSLKITGKGDDRITRSGDTAWVTRTCHIAAEMKEGKPIELDCRHTVIWVRQAGRWLIAHEHVSVPLPG